MHVTSCHNPRAHAQCHAHAHAHAHAHSCSRTWACPRARADSRADAYFHMNIHAFRHPRSSFSHCAHACARATECNAIRRAETHSRIGVRSHTAEQRVQRHLRAPVQATAAWKRRASCSERSCSDRARSVQIHPKTPRVEIIASELTHGEGGNLALLQTSSPSV